MATRPMKLNVRFATVLTAIVLMLLAVALDRSDAPATSPLPLAAATSVVPIAPSVREPQLPPFASSAATTADAPAATTMPVGPAPR